MAWMAIMANSAMIGQSKAGVARKVGNMFRLNTRVVRASQAYQMSHSPHATARAR